MIIQNQTLCLVFAMSLLVAACKDDNSGGSTAEDVAEDTIEDTEDTTIIDSGSNEIDSELEDIIDEADTPQAPFDAFIAACETNWELFCEALFDPECIDESRNFRGRLGGITEAPITTLEDCVLFSPEYCSLIQKGTAIRNGDIFDEESTSICLSTFEESSCYERISFMSENEAFCYEFAFNSRDTGESCFWDQDCINENDHCINEDFFGEFEGGICESLLSEHETCLLHSIKDCEEGFTCEYDRRPGYMGAVCTSVVSEGETCGTHACEEGLFCDYRICVPLRLEGEACEYHFDCNDYLYCHNEICIAAE